LEKRSERVTSAIAQRMWINLNGWPSLQTTNQNSQNTYDQKSAIFKNSISNFDSHYNKLLST
jgi:hypothetical protein